jgi:putative pyruvate formate lyase activating enzyme
MSEMEYREPRYLDLCRSGELGRRAERLWARLAACDICPRECGVNRLGGEQGFCRSGQLPIVASFCNHHGEEPVLSGSRGSGTIFFGNCNLRCLYCQNYQISQNWERQKFNEVDCHTLAEHMLYLQDELGCHNINLVSPSHFVPQIVRALVEAAPKGLRLPLVYNTNGYDSLETLNELDGAIDIYLPDIKYASDDWAIKLSQVPDYVRHSRNAIKEMYRQVGELVVDRFVIARRGLIVRHLILPNGLAGSRESLTWLAKEVSTRVTVSLMSQYHPTHRAYEFPLLSRGINVAEYEEAFKLIVELGLDRGWGQEMESHEVYLPDFEREEHPFRAK